MDKNRELKIEEPCHMRWAELDGAGTRRFCGECALHVVDGSSMTKSAAETLVEESEERVCMRVEVDGEGRPVHVPEPLAAGRVLSGIGWTLASGLLVSCVDGGAKEPVEPGAGPSNGSVTTTDATEPPLDRPLEILGEVCYPEDLPEEEEPVVDAEDDPDAVGEEQMGRMMLEKMEVMGAMVMHSVEAPPGPDSIDPD